MNIVVLCKSWNHKKVVDILQALHGQGLRVHGIVALAAPPARLTFTQVLRKTHEHGFGPLLAHLFTNPVERDEHAHGFIPVHGLHPTVALQARNGHSHFAHHPGPELTIAEYARQYQIEMACVQDLNSTTCATTLQNLRTDILLFGGVPIIRANILAVPKICTLNVHMGLLPEFRGMNVAEWAIFNGAVVGVTVHQVDAGVDTGAILYREKIGVADCATIAAMRAKVSRQQHLVLAQCTRLLLENKLPLIPQRKAEGKQYYLMHEKLKKIVERRLAQGYQGYLER